LRVEILLQALLRKKPPRVVTRLFDRLPYHQEIVEDRQGRFRSKRRRSQGPATDRDLTIIGAAPVQVAQNLVGLVDFTEAFGIRTLAYVGMHPQKRSGDTPA
jgi:hypothetical protein